MSLFKKFLIKIDNNLGYFWYIYGFSYLAYFAYAYVTISYENCWYDYLNTSRYDTNLESLLCTFALFFAVGFGVGQLFLLYPILVLLNIFLPFAAVYGVYHNAISEKEKFSFLGLIASFITFWISYKYSTSWFWNMMPDKFSSWF